MFTMPNDRSAPRFGLVAGEALHARLLGLPEAGEIALEWQDLADRALEPNAFYSPAITLAGLRHFEEGRGGRVLAVWRGPATERQLVGILPLVPARGRYFNPIPVLRAAQFYGTLSTPLLDPSEPRETFRAMMGALDACGIRGVVFPFLRQDGPVAAVIHEVCGGGGLHRFLFETHERPKLERGVPGADFARVTIDSKRRRKLERQRRRLADEGTLTFRIAASEPEVSIALEGFLELESSGWKGRLGTSLALASGGAPFTREMSRELAGIGRFRVATLALNDRPIAAGLIALAGARAFYLKIAYDEAYAKLSPGILLTLDLSCQLLEDPEIAETDSLAVANHPLYRGLWIARMTIGSEIVSTRTGGGELFRAAVAFERLRETVRTRSKPLRERAVARFKRRRADPADTAKGDESE